MLGEKLRKLREQKGQIQREVAEKIGVSQVVYNRYEKGERNPDFETLKKLADYFSVSTDYLLGRNLMAEAAGASKKNDTEKLLNPLYPKTDIKKTVENLLYALNGNDLVFFDEIILTPDQRKLLQLPLENTLKIAQCILTKKSD